MAIVDIPATTLTPVRVVLHGGTFGRAYTSDEFLDLCRRNPTLRIEADGCGDLILMTPTGGGSGRRGLHVLRQLSIWTETFGGEAFDSSTLFRLSNSAIRSPDGSWVAAERWNRLTEAEQEGVVPLTPDFIVELRSPSDAMADLRAKMTEYIECGVRLGWLIDPLANEAWVYRPGIAATRLDRPASLTGDPELPGFVLDLAAVWRR